MSCLLHLPQDRLQVLGHVVRLLRAPVVPLQVLQEAEEERVHCHGVDSEEGAGDDVTTNNNEHNRSVVVVERGNLLLDIVKYWKNEIILK